SGYSPGTSQNRTDYCIAIDCIGNRAAHANVAQLRIAEIERQVAIGCARGIDDLERLMCCEPRQHVHLNIVRREIAYALCEFERTHCRIGNDLEEDRLCRAGRMRIVPIELQPDGFVA